jgi:hypothetical protein
VGKLKYKLRSSRFYQNYVQVVGSISEIILFLGGFFLGKEMFLIALVFLIIRIAHKLLISELMYKRSITVVREELK